MRIGSILATFILIGGSDSAAVQPEASAPSGLRAGAVAIDVSPETFPVLVNGGFFENRATKVNDRLFARALVLDHGAIRLALVVVDSCMMPRDLLDRAKDLARDATGIPPERILISATHTHSAPAAMGALGCGVDPDYVALLPARLARAIERAAASLAPARVGWGTVNDERHTFCRRWIRRPDKILEDPFGNRTARANMHPGHVSPDAISPAGPVDPALTVLAVQSLDGPLIAILANYSQHYYGSDPVSADYFGRFATSLARMVAPQAAAVPVVMMTQGTSGDQMWMDYSRPREAPDVDRYAKEVAESAFQAYKQINAYHDRPRLAMAEAKLSLARRAPDEKRLAWARSLVAGIGSRPPKSLPEVYAREAIHLHDDPRRELKLQAIQIGELGITAIPNEVYALTGLKIKAFSPLATTMNIELANGSEGYIPPPEQHALGGYTTWPARTAGLEVQAEPRIVEAVLGLLERVSGRPRRDIGSRRSAYSEHVLASAPVAYWKLDEMAGTIAIDATGAGRPGRYHPGHALFLPGPDLPGFASASGINRAPQLAGGFLSASLQLPAESYAVELWFWNGLSGEVRPVVGQLLARGSDAIAADRVSLRAASSGSSAARLAFQSGHESEVLTGKTDIETKTWHHLVLSRQGRLVRVYLDGMSTPEFKGSSQPPSPSSAKELVIGGQPNSQASFEGKVDEVALYARPLSPLEAVEHFRAASDQRHAPERE